MVYFMIILRFYHCLVVDILTCRVRQRRRDRRDFASRQRPYRRRRARENVKCVYGVVRPRTRGGVMTGSNWSTGGWMTVKIIKCIMYAPLKTY